MLNEPFIRPSNGSIIGQIIATRCRENCREKVRKKQQITIRDTMSQKLSRFLFLFLLVYYSDIDSTPSHAFFLYFPFLQERVHQPFCGLFLQPEMLLNQLLRCFFQKFLYQSFSTDEKTSLYFLTHFMIVSIKWVDAEKNSLGV